MPYSAQILKKYPNKTLIELGTAWGDGVNHAIHAGFDHIISFEVMPDLYNFAKIRFSDITDKKIELILGSSQKNLERVLSRIDYPVTFLIDSHHSGGPTGYEDIPCPIFLELDIIKRHPIKNHTLLIDDRREFSSEVYSGVTEELVVQKILEINPDYELSFEDGHQKDDIIVAKVPA